MSKGMKVEASDTITSLIYRGLKREMEREYRDEIHVTDILYARRRVLRELYGEEVEKRDIYRYLRGRAIHGLLQDLLGQEMNGEGEVRVEYVGVVGSVDYVGNDVMVEFKTTYSSRESGYTREIAVKQLRLYMAMAGVSKGYAVIMYMRGDEIVGMEEFLIELSEEDIVEARRFIRERAEKIRRAIREKDPAIAPRCLFTWKCRYCKWRSMCEKLDSRMEFTSLSSFIR